MNISVFGLGIIGEIWAKHLERDGHQVRGWNRTPKNLPLYTSDPRDAAGKADAIWIVVADPPAVQGVLDKILPALHAPQIVIQSSTISPAASCSFDEQVRATGAAFLEAPFTGSKPAAEQRQTVFYVGGEPAVLEQVRPVMERLSRAIQHIGPVGSASALKLVMNVNIALVAEALSETLTLARNAGIPDDKYFAALKLNASHSPLADLKEPKLRQRDFAPQFSLKHMAKDLRLAMEMAEDLNIPLARAVIRQYEQGLQQGWCDDDFAVLARLLGRAT